MKLDLKRNEDLQIKKLRTIHDSHLLEGGAEYETGANGVIGLIVTQTQRNIALREMNDEFAAREKAIIDEIKKEILISSKDTDASELIKENGQLGSVEVIEVENDGEGEWDEKMVIVRDEENPSIGVLFFSGGFNPGTRGVVDIPVLDDRVPKGFINVRRHMVCACCHPKELKHPLKEKWSHLPEYERNVWDKTVEGKKYERWVKAKRAAFARKLGKLSRKYGLKEIIMRKGEYLEKEYPIKVVRLLDVEVLKKEPADRLTGSIRASHMHLRSSDMHAEAVNHILVAEY